MSEMPENEKRLGDGDSQSAMSPGFEDKRLSKSPRQSGGERRYERTLESDVGDDEEDATEETGGKSTAERSKNYTAYTIKLPSDQLSALQSIWLELKKLYGTHSPDKSGMIQAAVAAWLKRWDGPEHDKLLEELLDIRQSTRRRQYRKGK